MMLKGVLIALAAVLWMPLVSEVLSLLRRRRVSQVPVVSRQNPRLLILVPAHNEQLLIVGCVRSLLRMDYPPTQRRVVVIADNCNDKTAGLAREEGADVFERTEQELPGKPRAIAWALAQIDLTCWDACIIVDADSAVAPDFAVAISRLDPLNDIVFQANIGVLNEYDNWLTRLGGLLSRCRYEITYPLKQSAGLNCPVMGNGMGFGTSLLIRDGWRAFSITEDSELYAIYTEAGVPIRQAMSAYLFSQEPRSLGQGATQRRRWLAGRIRVIREWAVRLIRAPRIGWHQKLDAFVELGLASPVLNLLGVLAIVLTALFAVTGRAGLWIAAFAVASLAGIVVTTVIGILRHPQPWRTATSFLMLPVYAAWRTVVAVATLFTLGDRTWRKTARTAPQL